MPVIHICLRYRHVLWVKLGMFRHLKQLHNVQQIWAAEPLTLRPGFGDAK
jgi:hypothetical protein